jgi:hypothetical protein
VITLPTPSDALVIEMIALGIRARSDEHPR